MHILGFTLLRNGIRYDYPFRESLLSLSGICEKIYLALGNSDDGTESALPTTIEIIPTVWDEQKRKGGEILSEQTNIALNAAKKAVSSTEPSWGLYLQADEIISESDYALIRQDIERAHAQGCDAVSFRYLHFWHSYEQIAYRRRWYPQEIRAVRLDMPIESYGDAQSFRGWTKRYESEATIYHYGHVREAGAYAKKKKDFHRWWHSDSELTKIFARGEKSDAHESTLRYLGPHPKAMEKRIAISPKTRDKIYLYGKPSNFAPDFAKKLYAENIEWTDDLVFLGSKHDRDFVILQEAPFWARFLHAKRFALHVPQGMESPQARPWTPEFRALLACSEKGIYFK